VVSETPKMPRPQRCDTAAGAKGSIGKPLRVQGRSEGGGENREAVLPDAGFVRFSLRLIVAPYSLSRSNSVEAFLPLQHRQCEHFRGVSKTLARQRSPCRKNRLQANETLGNWSCGPLLLGASTVHGGLSVNAASIAQSGPLVVSGVLGLAVTAAGGDIDLSTQANSFSSHGDRYAGLGVVIEGDPAKVRDFKLRNTSAAAGAIGMLGYGYKGNNIVAVTNLRDLTIHYDHAAYVVPNLTMPSLRNVNIVATAISQLAGASMTVLGTATFHATAGAILLPSAGNDFRGAVSLISTGNASITDANSLVLGKSSIGGNLVVTMGAAGNYYWLYDELNQTGDVTVFGATTITPRSAGTAIDLST